MDGHKPHMCILTMAHMDTALGQNLKRLSLDHPTYPCLIVLSHSHVTLDIVNSSCDELSVTFRLMHLAKEVRDNNMMNSYAHPCLKATFTRFVIATS